MNIVLLILRNFTIHRAVLGATGEDKLTFDMILHKIRQSNIECSYDRKNGGFFQLMKLLSYIYSDHWMMSTHYSSNSIDEISNLYSD